MSVDRHRVLEPLPIPRVGKLGVPIKSSQLWQREFVAGLRKQARDRVKELGSVEVVADYIGRRRRQRDEPGATLDALCHILAVFDELEVPAPLALKLLGWGRAILVEQGIDPRRSRVAGLHADLEAHAASLALSERDRWNAAWAAGLASLSTDDGAVELIELGELALLAGDVAGVLDGLVDDASSADGGALRASRARWLRLSGRPGEAETVVSNAGDSPGRWERACARATVSGSLQPIAHLLRDRRVSTPERQLDFWLWAHATRSRRWRRQVRRLSTLRRALGGSVAIRCARAIESLTRRTSRPMARLREVGEVLKEAADIGSAEGELLVWAAAARCLHQAKQPRFAELALARYRSLSILVSAARTDDVLAVASDFDGRAEPNVEWDELALSARDSRVPRRARERYVAYGQMAVGAVLSQVQSSLRGGDARLELCELLSDHLGYLKGPLMKVGQFLSHYGMGFDIRERELFASLYDRAPAVDFGSLVTTIEDELGPPGELFAELATVPLATGSFGQVHAARLHDGRRVVVKVQYPGADAALHADLSLLRLCAPVLARVRPGLAISALIDELASLVEREIDYRNEAENQELFAQLFAGDDDIVIPRVIGSHTTRRVLTSERLDGVRLAEVADRADQAERNAVAERVVRFISRCIFVEGVLHTDPHPGNFLIFPGRIGVVDFGSVKRWDQTQSASWFAILEAIVDDDAEALSAAFAELGMLGGSVDVEFALRAMRRWTMRWTTGTGPARFDIDDVANEIRTWMGEPALKNLVIQPQDLYGFRIYWGMFALLARLDAEVDLRPMVERIRRWREERAGA